jgi:EpsI family protein
VIGRALVLSAMIVAAGALACRGNSTDTATPRHPLDAFPRAIEGWTAAGDVPLDQETRDILRADDYLDRNFRGPDGRVVNLYVAYYASQRQGEAIHSPQNCLPGSGWQPVESGVEALPVASRAIPVNRYVIERSGLRQLAYYWYQGRGRVVANEFANKFWLIADAARFGRSDGALVRVMTTMTPGAGGAADAAGTEFSRRAFPVLSRYLP